MSEATPILPAHIEETVEAIARLHADHYNQAAPLQRAVDRLTARVGRPEFVGVLAIIAIGWIGANLALLALGAEPFDPPPFAWLQGGATLLALAMTCLILTTQRREDELAGHREQLTLELAILSEQKAAKVIALMEEMRRDHPGLRDRVDVVAQAMSSPVDPQAVLDAIKGRHEELSVAAGAGLAEAGAQADPQSGVGMDVAPGSEPILLWGRPSAAQTTTAATGPPAPGGDHSE